MAGVRGKTAGVVLVRMASVLLVATCLDGAAGADMPLAMNPEAWIRQVRVPGESRWLRLCACTWERLAAPNDVRCWVLGEPVAPARVGSMLLRSPSSKPRCEGGTIPKGFIRGRLPCGWNSWSVAAHKPPAIFPCLRRPNIPALIARRRTFVGKHLRLAHRPKLTSARHVSPLKHGAAWKSSETADRQTGPLHSRADRASMHGWRSAIR